MRYQILIDVTDVNHDGEMLGTISVKGLAADFGHTNPMTVVCTPSTVLVRHCCFPNVESRMDRTQMREGDAKDSVAHRLCDIASGAAGGIYALHRSLDTATESAKAQLLSALKQAGGQLDS